MKKIITLILALVVISAFIFVTTGCNKDNSSNSSSQAEQTKGVLARGTIDGNVYNNTFADFTFTKPDSWSYSTDEEIASFIGYDPEKLNINEIEKALSKNPVIYDMIVAGDSYYGNSILVSYENVLPSVGRKITEDEYVEVLKETFSQAQGITYTITETKDVTLGNSTFKRATILVEAEGMSTTQYYYIKAIDQYVVSIMVNLTSEYTIDQVEAMFS